MAIAKKPSSKPSDDDTAAKFIAGADGGTGDGAKAAPSPDSVRARIPTMVRFNADLLDKVDAAARKRGISRSAWIQYTLSSVLED